MILFFVEAQVYNDTPLKTGEGLARWRSHHGEPFHPQLSIYMGLRKTELE